MEGPVDYEKDCLRLAYAMALALEALDRGDWETARCYLRLGLKDRAYLLNHPPTSSFLRLD